MNFVVIIAFLLNGNVCQVNVWVFDVAYIRCVPEQALQLHSTLLLNATSSYLTLQNRPKPALYEYTRRGRKLVTSTYLGGKIRWDANELQLGLMVQ